MTNPYEQFAPSARATQAINPYAQFSSASANPYAQFVPQQQKSIGQRIGQDLANRVQVGNNIVNSPDLNPIVKPIAYVGNVGAGLANDVIKEGMKSVGSVIPQPVKDMASGAADLLREGASYIPGARAYSDAVAATPDMSKQYPNAAALAQSVGNVAKLGGSLAGMAQAAGMARQGINATSDAMGTAASKVTPTLAEQAAKDKAAASAGYEAQANIPFTPEQQTTLQNNLTKLIPKNDASMRVWNKSAASGHVDDLLGTMTTEPLTFDGALAQRNAINGAWKAATRSGNDNEARLISGVKDALDKSMINPETGEWQGANRQWGIASTKQDFSDMVDVAEGRAQPGNSLDTAINKYVNSWRGNTLTAGEKDILNQITTQTFTKELKRNIAGRLQAAVGAGIGGMVGGAPGAVVGDLLGSFAAKVARDSVMSDKVAALQEFFDELDKRPMPKVPQAAPPAAPPLQITGPGAVMTADSEGNISRTPNPANEVVNTQPRPITPQNIPPAYQPTPSPQLKMLPSPNSARPMSDAEIAQYQDLLKNGSPKTGGVPVGNPEGNPVPNAQSTVRNPNDGLLDKAIKEPIGTATQNEGYQNLTWIKQRQIDKLIPQYTSNTLSKAQVVRQMSQVGLSVQDADEILSSAYQSKIWRNGQLKLTPAEIAKLSPKQAADYLKNNK